jgi:hypothetical protein
VQTAMKSVVTELGIKKRSLAIRCATALQPIC